MSARHFFTLILIALPAPTWAFPDIPKMCARGLASFRLPLIRGEKIIENVDQVVSGTSPVDQTYQNGFWQLPFGALIVRLDGQNYLLELDRKKTKASGDKVYWVSKLQRLPLRHRIFSVATNPFTALMAGKRFNEISNIQELRRMASTVGDEKVLYAGLPEGLKNFAKKSPNSFLYRPSDSAFRMTYYATVAAVAVGVGGFTKTITGIYGRDIAKIWTPIPWLVHGQFVDRAASKLTKDKTNAASEDGSWEFIYHYLDEAELENQDISPYSATKHFSYSAAEMYSRGGLGEINKYVKRRDAIDDFLKDPNKLEKWFRLVQSNPLWVDGWISSGLTNNLYHMRPNLRLSSKLLADVLPEDETVWSQTYGSISAQFVAEILERSRESLGDETYLKILQEFFELHRMREFEIEKLSIHHQGSGIVGGPYIATPTWQNSKMLKLFIRDLPLTEQELVDLFTNRQNSNYKDELFEKLINSTEPLSSSSISKLETYRKSIQYHERVTAPSEMEWNRLLMRRRE